MITLQEDLRKGTGGRLDSIYGQCMYFGLSFSRVGADFRGIIIPIFHRYAWKQFSNNVLKATKRWGYTELLYDFLHFRRK